MLNCFINGLCVYIRTSSSSDYGLLHDYYHRPHTNIKLKLFSILRNNQRVKHSDLADDDDTLVLLVGSAAAAAAAAQASYLL